MLNFEVQKKQEKVGRSGKKMGIDGTDKKGLLCKVTKTPVAEQPLCHRRKRKEDGEMTYREKYEKMYPSAGKMLRKQGAPPAGCPGIYSRAE